MKLYTRTGDDGTTGLFGGERVDKDHPRVEAYGTVDEINACIGFAAAACAEGEPGHPQMMDIFRQLQSRLFEIGADLATPAGSAKESTIGRIAESHVVEAEAWIDQIEAGNDPMSHFVLPGGTELAGRLHLARTVCRRAERRLVNLSRSATINPSVVKYLNRIGDLLFAMARRANKDGGVADIPWKPQDP